ncbi:MAG TPA: hypothetical protein VE597_01475 [Geminicoccaceae bacterium]|jgi:hypothetical protein|nr:hypothetical protein [Geminicoccaceae bacterium]
MLRWFAAALAGGAVRGPQAVFDPDLEQGDDTNATMRRDPATGNTTGGRAGEPAPVLSRKAAGLTEKSGHRRAVSTCFSKSRSAFRATEPELVRARGGGPLQSM